MMESLALVVALALPAETECLAQNIYFEARNQSYVGKLATAHVVFNRMADPRFPSTACDVVKQARYDKSGRIIRNKCQFSWYCDGLSDKPKEHLAWEDAISAAEDAMILWNNGYDMSEGATFYHSRNVNPRWNRNMEMTVQIDDHLFYRND
jgi:N-acetylmuramoyl-L-alanine amidase